MNSKTPVLSAEALGKTYSEGPEPVVVLEDLSFALYPGERVAVVGSSGSGKSTLLNLLGGLDKPSTGEVRLMGQAFSSQSETARGRLRNQHMGFVYQFHHLLPEFTAQENVEMPLRIAGKTSAQYQARAAELLTQVGLSKRLQHKPAELSGGERQRVAIARALAMQPACVLMDEPTGNLDKDNALAIEQLMLALTRQHGVAFVVVTHDPSLARKMDRVLRLESGRLQPEVETA